MLRFFVLCVVLLVACVPDLSGADPLKLKLTAAIEEEYTDNAAFDSGSRQDDLVTRISAGLQGGWQTEIASIQLGGRLENDYYRENKNLDSEDHSYTGRLTYKWDPRFTTSVSAGYTSDDSKDRELSETGLLLSDGRHRQIYDVNGHYQISELSAVSLTCGVQIEDFDNEQTSDRNVQSLQLMVSRSLAPVIDRAIGRLQLTADQYEYSREYDTVDPVFGIFNARADERQTIQNYSVSLGVSHQWTERFQITVDLGARFTDSQRKVFTTIDSGLPDLDAASFEERRDSWGYVAMLEAGYARAKGDISIMASHDLVPASGRGGSTERTELQLSGSEHLTGKLAVTWSAKGFLNCSEDGDVGSGIDELTMQLGAGLHYTFDQRWRAGLYWLGSRIENREIDSDSSKNTYTLQISWNWPVLE